MNSLSQACLQLSEFTPSNQKKEQTNASASEDEPPTFNLRPIPVMGDEKVESASEDDCYDDRPRTMSLTNYCKQVLQDNIHDYIKEPIEFAPETYVNEVLDSSLNFADEYVGMDE